MKSFRLTLVVTTLFTMLFSLGASAQGFVSMLTVKTNAASDGQITAVINSYRKAMDQSNAPLYWRAMQSITGEDHYLFVRFMDNMSELGWDESSAFSRLGQNELESMANNMRAASKTGYTQVFAERPDLCMPNEPMSSVPDGIVMIDIEIKQGMNETFETWAKQVREASAAVTPEAYCNMVSPVMGADNHYMVAIIIQNWTDLDNEPMMNIENRVLEHFGQRRGQQMISTGNEAVVKVSTNLYRTRPDLSRTEPQ